MPLLTSVARMMLSAALCLGGPSQWITLGQRGVSVSVDGYEFNFEPAAPPHMQALNLVNSSSPQPFGSATTWGGSVLFDQGLYHMYASIFKGHCGLSSWESNSFVVHGTSTAAGGPYAVKDIAVPSFAHNPEILYSKKERRYLLFTLGYANHSAPVPCNATTGKPVRSWGGYGAPPWLKTVSLHTADSPHGPAAHTLEIKLAQKLSLRCVLRWVPGVPTKARLKSRTKKFKPHSVYCMIDGVIDGAGRGR